MHDYGSFEKVGEIGDTLPRNDEQCRSSRKTASENVLFPAAWRAAPKCCMPAVLFLTASMIASG